MPDFDFERITDNLRRNRETLERDMSDPEKSIDSAGLLDRIEALRKRIETSRATFGIDRLTDEDG